MKCQQPRSPELVRSVAKPDDAANLRCVSAQFQVSPHTKTPSRHGVKRFFVALCLGVSHLVVFKSVTYASSAQPGIKSPQVVEDSRRSKSPTHCQAKRVPRTSQTTLMAAASSGVRRGFTGRDSLVMSRVGARSPRPVPAKAAISARLVNTLDTLPSNI